MNKICLLDTNVLLRRAQRDHAMHAAAGGAVVHLLQQDYSLCVFPQTLYEFWAVVTRPPTARGGFGWTTSQCEAEADELLSLFALVTGQEKDIFNEWRRLVSTYHVSGMSSHDARLVAAMKTHNISDILTFNTSDFTRYTSENIRVLDPAQVAATI